MEAVHIKKAWKAVKFHAKIAWRGLCRTFYGTSVAGLIAMAVYGFSCIGNEGGWAAVCDFITSFTALIVAALNIYVMGRPRKAAKNG